MHRFFGIVLVLALVVLAGCGGSEKAVPVPFDQVPPNLIKIAQEQLPDVKFDHARKLPNGVYEIRGKGDKGKVREVEVSPEGKVLEIE
jgi:hypothetical protein